jgi:cell division protein FtsL
MNKKAGWIPLWAVPVLVFMAIGTVWLRLTIVRMTYSVAQTEKMIRNLQHSRETAEVKLASMKSPRRLEALARSKFGLSQPHSDQVVHIK